MSEVDIEAQNLEEIELLNQRGGRTLSVVDLINAGTLSVEAAAFIFCAVTHGESILMGARPGGAGKSTLLATALGFLPPGERLITTSSKTVIDRGLKHPPPGAECFLAHEIGSGHFYGYIWGSDVREFFSLMDADRRIASCLHADTADEAEDILIGAPLHVPRDLVHRLGLLGFMRVIDGAGGPIRRVSYLYGSGLRLAFRWRESDDLHEQVAEPSAFGLREEDFARATDFLGDLVAAGIHLFEAVRERVQVFHHRHGR
jgi:energy-coupling factor transporter ATP-binding protein EcfA2